MKAIVTQQTREEAGKHPSYRNLCGFWCVVIGLLSLVLVGCGGDKSAHKRSGKSGGNTIPSENIVLPEAPDFRLPPTRSNVPGRPEAVLTVWGVLSEFETLGNDSVAVVGTVADLQICPEENEMRCDLPTHAVLTHSDERNGFRLIVVGPQLKSLALRVGQQEVFTGRLATLSPDGRIVAVDGLLLLDELEESESEPTRKRTRKSKRRKSPAPIKTDID